MNPVDAVPPGKVAIAVPLSNRPELTADEQISLRHLNHFLGRYDKYLILPKGLTVDLPGFSAKRFPSKYFGSVEAHNRLCLSSRFYESFKEYEYLLMYHLDALVFSDQLLEWCDAGFDFIGAPWIRTDDTPWVEKERVGNGGFTLMKIESFLKVFRSRRHYVDPDAHWAAFCAQRSKLVQLLNTPRKYLKRLHYFNGARWQMARWQKNADFFWSDEARRYYPEFAIPPVETALRFAFEAAPRVCFERNQRQLPFGCHAWMRYDRTFWEPYLLR